MIAGNQAYTLKYASSFGSTSLSSYADYLFDCAFFSSSFSYSGLSSWNFPASAWDSSRAPGADTSPVARSTGTDSAVRVRDGSSANRPGFSPTFTPTPGLRPARRLPRSR